MNHQLQLENKKYRNWVKAGLGLRYLKEGLEPFSDDIVRQQHVDILNSVKQTCNVTTVNCGNCNLKTLMPNHVRISSRNCPLGQANCNCLYPRGKIVCPNNVCGAIYDTIVTVHNSRPPAPFWKNTDVKKWCTDPWAVAKCFINAQGYAQKTSAAEIDCSGLLHVIINNKSLHSHIQCIISGNDEFCKTRQARNAIFHSVTMELEDSGVNDYIDDMIAILEDGKELHARPESVEAVKKLQEIKNDAFIITKETERDVIRAAHIAFDQKGKELEQKIATAIASIEMKSKEGTESREKAKAEFLETSRSAEKKLDNKTKVAIEKIQSCETSFLQKTKNSTDNLQNITEESIDQIKTAGEATIRKIRDAIRLPTIKEATSLKQTQEKKSGVRFESMPSMIRQQKHETNIYHREKIMPQQYGEDYERKKRGNNFYITILK
ncbi:uncharacterized protein LOC123545283 [Mercenaria mercenaria]|uniref:uncharacterized protein LOC123545283 n=1 Tax=Mercenaria mercenaria TaxID=6596 RepID=UPI00234EEE77|nr:uncharacterized protein LOC123545283 [Mercenaria mercenaria]